MKSELFRSSTTSRGLTAGVFFAAAALLAEAQAQDSTMRSLGDSRGVFIGTAVTFPSGGNAANRPEYERVLRTEFNGVVAENAMKFQSLSSARGTYNFSGGDALVDFAVANDMKVRGHTLVWHSQAAGWFNNLSGSAASRDTTLKIMKQHIDTVMGRWRGKIYEWDVVNEAIAAGGGASPNYRTNGSAWYSRVGADFIDSAFVYAHRADSTALLFYNDFGAEEMGSSMSSMHRKSQNVYDLVSGMKARGIPIHGVGLQCHYDAITQQNAEVLLNIDTAAVRQNIRRIAALGLKVSMTEVDMQFRNTGTPSEAYLNHQKANYKALAAVCFSEPSCTSFFVWGLNDNQSWRTPQASRAPLLFTGTSAITPKPAYFGVVEALTAAPVVAVHDVLPSMPNAGVRSPLMRARQGGAVGAVDARGGLRDLRGRSLPASVRRAMQP